MKISRPFYYKSKNFSKNIFFFLFNYIIIFAFINAEIAECEKDIPILISRECKLEYCSKEQFDSKYCIINNTIIKTQWINNFIVFSDKTYSYLNFGSFSNGDIVIESTCYPQKPKRI